MTQQLTQQAQQVKAIHDTLPWLSAGGLYEYLEHKGSLLHISLSDLQSAIVVAGIK